MKNLMFTCYHNTSMEAAENIIKSQKMEYKKSDKHYLGQGVYFFQDKEIAEMNIENSFIQNAQVILSVDIECKKINFLDLDEIYEIKKYKAFVKSTEKNFKDEGIEITFRNNLDYKNNTNIYIMCFMMDLYKEYKGYHIVKRTYFKSTRNLFFSDMKYDPIPYPEIYVCVSELTCIRKIKMSNNTYDIEERLGFV